MMAWIVLLAVGLLSRCDAFNVDTSTFVRHRGPRDSMFGFSVAQHSERGYSWVLIGAPEAQTHQPGVDRGGAVFKCDINRDDACYEVIFDANGNNNDSAGHQIDKKSFQWFGATLSSAGQDGPVVACAPRYVSYSAKYARRDPVGTCYVARRDFSDILEFAPCRTRNWGYHRQGSCQAGLGAAMSKDGRRLYIGAPGSWYWQGQLYSQSLDSRPAVMATAESHASDDDSYLGYSVAVGDFSGHSEQGVAVGMPRGSHLLGKVVLYTWDLQNHHNVTGEQLGAYFGYCICSGDIDGDGLDDLIVGAPLYTIPNNKGNYENGRVYVIYQGRAEQRFGLTHFRDGVNSKARFGLSVTSLSDINLDGFGDFAVGAPYDGPFERGAVYIYHGSADGVMEKYSQVIHAEDVAQTPLNTFGFSLSGGVDLDGNQYTDLVVGAYDADTVMFFKSRPVVKMAASVLFHGSESKLISLEEKNCTLFNRQKVVCTRINYCLKYDGINVDTQIEFNLQFILDSKKLHSPRMFFLDYEGRNTFNHSLTLDRGQMYCSYMGVYIVDGVRDKLTPLEVELRYSMRSEDRMAANVGRVRNTRAVLTPTLDRNVLNVQRDSINIQKNCGLDNVCIPDLKMVVTPSVDRYLLGSKERLWFDILVQNSGEDAFEATYSTQLPPGVDYVKVERVGGSPTDIPVQCSPPSHSNNNTLHCDIGNPLPKGKLVHFKLLLDPYHKTGMAPTYDFKMDINSTNPELNNTESDNSRNFSIGIWVETDLALTATSVPPDLHYNETNYKVDNETHEADIGPQVVHMYSARNNGPSTIEEAELYIVWPYETLAGDELMYLLEQPETSGVIQCEQAEHVNSRDLIVDRKRKSYLQRSGVDLQTSGEVTGGGVKIEGGSSGTFTKTWSTTSSSSTGQRGGAKVLTDEQKKRIDEEEKKFSAETGDASLVHKQRAEQAQNAGQTSSKWSSEMQYGAEKSAEGGSNQIDTVGRVTGHSTGYKMGHWESTAGGGRQWVSGSTSYTGRGDGQTGGQWSRTQSETTRESNQNPGTYRHSYNVSWNSSRDGTGPAVIHHASSNTSILTGAGGVIIDRKETSTEYYTFGREGETGSSFSNRFNENEERRAGSSFRGQSEGRQRAKNEGGYSYQETNQGSTNYAPGGYIQGGGRRYNAATGDKHYGRTNASYTVDGLGRHKWSTEETVNKELANAGSQTYTNNGQVSGYRNEDKELANAGSQTYTNNGQVSGYRNEDEEYRRRVTAGRQDSNYRETGIRQAGNTYVGKPQQPEGFGAVAYGRNNDLRTNTLDLGVLPPSGYVDQELRSAAAGRTAQGGYEMESRRQYSEGEQGPQSHDTRSSSHYIQYGQQFPTEPNRDNVETERPVIAGTHFRWDRNTRHRRETASEDSSIKNDPELAEVLQCKSLQCARVKCIIGPLHNGDEVWLAIRSRINAKTFKKLAGSQGASISTLAAARVSRLPYIGRPAPGSGGAVKAVEALTTVSAQSPPPLPEPVPLWLVVLSAAAGTAILLLLIFALYKCGFFKRNRPSEAPERQPLNRNGYGHGDEQL